jgi:hypothetical protein
MNQEQHNAQEEVYQGGHEQPVAPTRPYFTRELEDTIRDMSDEEMFRELTNLEQTRAWIAILKYNQARLSVSQSAIFSADPLKDPVGIARNQGIMLGVCDLQNAVIMIKQEREEDAKEEEANKGQKS